LRQPSKADFDRLMMAATSVSVSSVLSGSASMSKVSGGGVPRKRLRGFFRTIL
jgi:hypothetical protein